MAEELSAPNFEIDHPDAYAPFLLDNPPEILFYLNQLAKYRCQISAYIDDDTYPFPTAITAIEEATGQLFLIPSSLAQHNVDAGSTSRITLLTELNRVKMQLRLSALRQSLHQGQPVLAAALPKQLLRLQRRDFFRLEPLPSPPIVCQLAATAEGGVHTFELPLLDISGGGVCLTSSPDIAPYFPRNAKFQQCRLEIPNDGVVQVNLRVRKTVEMSSINGLHSLRIGCEFVNLTGSSQSFIERYITRVERERNAKDSGLVD